MNRHCFALRTIVVTAWLLCVAAPGAAEVPDSLLGTWTAMRAEREGKPAADVLGHRLNFSGSRFIISAADGKRLFAGTVQTDPKTMPAGIDFTHTEGALQGKTWHGIYAVDGDALRICDNAPDLEKARPASFAAPAGSGYVMITFTRNRR